MGKKILSYFILFLFGVLIISFSPISHASTSYSLDYGWEYENVGVGVGNSGLIDYKQNGTDTNYFNVSDSAHANGTKSFRVRSDNRGSVDDIIGWWNLTTEFNYISEIQFWCRFIQCSDSEINMRFYDSYDNELIKIRWDETNDLDVYSLSSGWNMLDDSLNLSTWLKYTFRHISDNTINFTVKDINNYMVGYYQGSMSSVNSWETFSYITFTGGEGPLFVELYFDDFNVTTDSGLSQWESCIDNYWTIEKHFNSSNCVLNESLKFHIFLDEVIIGPPAPITVYIENSNGDIVDQKIYYSRNFNYYYTPVLSDGYGTYIIKLKFNTGNFFCLCPFTVVEGDLIGEWYINIKEDVYSPGDNVIAQYKIPLGEKGNISWIRDIDMIGMTGGRINGLIGTGEVEEIYLHKANEVGYCYYARLHNFSDYSIMDNDFYCIGEEGFNYELFVNGKNNYCKVEVDDNVRITGYASYTDYPLIIKFFNNSSRTDDYLIDYINIGVGDHSSITENYIARLNETDGIEYIYVSLGTGTTTFMDKYWVIWVYDEGELEPFDTGDTWYGLPYFVPYLIGVFLTLFITFSPLVIASYITRKTKWKSVSIPPLLYVGFFFMGLITSVLMGFLPVWLPFVILFSMVVYFAVQWLYGSRQATGEE